MRLKKSVQFVYVNQFYTLNRIPSSLFQFTVGKPSKLQPTPGYEFRLRWRIFSESAHSEDGKDHVGICQE